MNTNRSRDGRQTTAFFWAMIFLPFLLTAQTTIQTDWSGGPGSLVWSDATTDQFDWSNGIDYTSFPGSLILDPTYQAYTQTMLMVNNDLLVPMVGYGTFRIPGDLSMPHLWQPGLYWRWGIVTGEQIFATNGGLVVYHYDGTENDYGTSWAGWEVLPDSGFQADFSVNALLYHNDILYAAGRLYTTASYGGQVYQFVEDHWTQVGATFTQAALSLTIFNGELWAGAHWSGGIYRYTGGAWTLMYNQDMSVVDLIVYNNELYAATQATNYTTGHLVKFDGNTWSVIYTGEGVTTLAIHNNTLYFGTDGTGKVYHLNETTPVFDYNLANGERCVGDLLSFNGQLYAAAGYDLDTNDPRAGYLYANNTSSVKLQCSPLRSSEFNLGETGGGIRVDWNATAPAGTGVSLWGQSRTAEEAWDNTARWYDIPKGEPVAMEDSLIRYQAFLWSIFDGATPVLEEVSIETHVTVADSLEISDIRIMPLDATSVQISWHTNIPARGLAFLGTEQGNYPIEGMEYPGFFNEHSVVIGDLTTGTMYYGVIHQSDETYDQYVISEEFSFVMEPYTGSVQIQNIWDVADDQGGWVYVNWLADGWDFTGEITQYGVWEFNANEGWVSVGSVPATQSEHYTYLAHTFGDSSMDGIFWSRFVITAHTMTPDEFFVSPVDSGYSVDNIHPGIPTNLLAEFETTDGVRLTWDAPLDEDFSHYEIFRDLTPDFVPTESLAELVDITYLDPVADLTQTYYYRIRTVDLHGNRSEPTAAVAATFTGINARGIPDHYALEAAFPNPFNPATNIRFALPETGLARLVIYDARGQVVKALLEREFSAGVHQIRWDGRNNAGVLVSTGIYFCRLEVNGFSQTHKMILMK